MPIIRVALPDEAAAAPDWPALRTELGIAQGFPPEVEAEANAVTTVDVLSDRADLRGVDFFTVDPPDSLDLDQAMHFARQQGGYLVQYAIADVGTFVRPTGALDFESHERGETFYSPDENELLYPSILSEGAASLLPGVDRAAVVWEMTLSPRGELLMTSVRRAVVQSKHKLSYVEVQRSIDGASPADQFLLLKEVGTLRQQLAQEHGAVDLPTPEQVVSTDKAGNAELTYRAALPCEEWNAQISLLTGIAAAQTMLAGNVGLLRTLPTPDPESVESLKRSAAALDINWPDGVSYGAVLSALDPRQPAAAALLTFATRLLRGAAYTAFNGGPPSIAVHSAVAAPYAHCTAPLRRLADRYVNEICLALTADVGIPGWVANALGQLPEEMAKADRKAHALDRAAVDLAEAYVLRTQVGKEFDASVVEVNKQGGVVQLNSPAVRASYVGPPIALGTDLKVRLEVANPSKREVRFGPVSVP